MGSPAFSGRARRSASCRWVGGPSGQWPLYAARSVPASTRGRDAGWCFSTPAARPVAGGRVGHHQASGPPRGLTKRVSPHTLRHTFRDRTCSRAARTFAPCRNAGPRGPSPPRSCTRRRPRLSADGAQDLPSPRLSAPMSRAFVKEDSGERGPRRIMGSRRATTRFRRRRGRGLARGARLERPRVPSKPRLLLGRAEAAAAHGAHSRARPGSRATNGWSSWPVAS